MKISKEERAANRAAFKQMKAAQKADYIFTYYKIPLVLAAFALLVLGTVVQKRLAYKEPLLYCGFFNVSAGEALEAQLDSGFVSFVGRDPRRCAVEEYTGLYLSLDPATQDHEYAYASRMKLLATIESKTLDVVLMNREAYDILSANGYLLALPPLLAQDSALADRLAPHLAENTVILSDNQIEFDLGTAEEYVAETEQAVNGIDLSGFPLFAQAGFTGEVYLGVIGNTPRPGAVLDFIAYLDAAP